MHESVLFELLEGIGPIPNPIDILLLIGALNDLDRDTLFTGYRCLAFL